MTPEALAALHARAMTTSRPWSAAEFEGLLGQAGVFLETVEGGFALGRVILDEAELLTLAIDPAHQRQGRGRDCLRRFEATARSRGAVTAFLEVAADNPAAIALYLGADWTEAGRRREYYPRGDGKAAEALLFRRDLAVR